VFEDSDNMLQPQVADALIEAEKIHEDVRSCL